MSSECLPWHVRALNRIFHRKLRSDEILAQDARASVMVAPPGTNPADYTQNLQRGGWRGRGRGRGRGGRRGGGGARMEID